MSPECEAYRPRQPASGTLHTVLLENLETFLARIDEDPATRGLPRWVERELRGVLRCGVLSAGFCRVHCSSCGADLLVPFSCKGRGFCPSCGGRRMAEAAAHLVDHVFPEEPVRQWVLSFPWRLRYLLALDPRLCRAVRKVFLRAVFGFYSRKAAGEEIGGGKTGAVCQVQRFGSALNANLHFHALLIDGVYTAPDPHTKPVFHHARRITGTEVAKLLFTIRSRVLRLCRRRGLMGEEELEVCVDESEQGVLPLFCAASIQGRVAMGPEAGARVSRLGQPPVRCAAKAVLIKELCAELDGFTLHAAVKVAGGDVSRLEHLCRYVTRPPLSTQRLSLNDSGQVVHELRVPFRDGTTHFVFDPLTFIERLAALVPPPRMHQLTYHGVLAPGASWRGQIVPGYAGERRGVASSGSASRPCAKYSWSELMSRVFSVDVLSCPICGSRRRWIAAITEAEVIARILEHLGLPSTLPTPAPARPPPQLEFAY